MANFIINKKILLNNVDLIKRKLSSNVKFCAMVKANAYSHGVHQIVKAIESKVDYFGVANVLEGIEVRKVNVDKPILCVGGFVEDEICLAEKYKIELTIYNNYSFELLKAYNASLNVHIKIDTGMTRLGFRNINEVKNIVKNIEKSKLNLIGVYSHFSNSDDYNKSLKQINKFKQYAKLFKSKSVIKHISNSNGITEPSFQLDMCRVGIAMYGYGNIKGLKPVLSIISNVVDTHFIKAGETVGYEQKYIAKKDSYIATVKFGYADGMDLRYSGYYVVVNGKRYKIIGKICMDMFMCLVDKDVKVGDLVIILDDANMLAKHASKSVYEVLSNFKNTRSKIILI